MSDYSLKDRDGDEVTLTEDYGKDAPGHVLIHTPGGSVYVTPDELRRLADEAERILGVTRKAEGATPALFSPDRLALVEAAKDLLRRAAGDVDGDLVVFLGAES